MRDAQLPDLVPVPAGAPDLDDIVKPPENIASQPPWEITSDGAADWAMVQLSTAAATLAQLKEQRAGWLQLVDQWFKNASAPVERTVTFFEFHLQGYAMQRRAESPRDKKGEPTLKTLQLVTGRVSTTGQPERVIVTAETDVVEWAKRATALVDFEHEAHVGTWQDHHGVTHWIVPVAALGVVKRVESVLVSELRKFVNIVDVDVAPEGSDEPLIVRRAVGPDGEAVPGVAVIPADVTAKVTPAL